MLITPFLKSFVHSSSLCNIEYNVLLNLKKKQFQDSWLIIFSFISLKLFFYSIGYNGCQFIIMWNHYYVVLKILFWLSKWYFLKRQKNCYAKFHNSLRHHQNQQNQFSTSRTVTSRLCTCLDECNRTEPKATLAITPQNQNLQAYREWEKYIFPSTKLFISL